MTKPIVYPLLIIVTNSHETIWYHLTAKNSATEIARIRDTKAVLSDNEGLMDRIMDQAWIEETRLHLKKCAEKTAELWATHTYNRLLCAAPSEIKNQLSSALAACSILTYDYLAGNFTQESLKEKLLEAVDALLHPLA